jgi:hypothetical protein
MTLPSTTNGEPLRDIPSLTDVWIQTISKQELADGQEIVIFGSTASLTQKAVSDRAEQILEGNK